MKMKKAQNGIPGKKPVAKKSSPKKEEMIESEMFPGKMIPKSKSNYENGKYTKMLEDNRKATLKSAAKKAAPKSKMENGGKTAMAKGGKQMMKRADGSTSQRGLWDNIRAAKGSGKKPTAAMLKQEKKIKAKTKK